MNAGDQSAGDVFAETPEVHDRNLRIGIRVVAGSTIMFFFAFAFAYFYLRSLNSNGLWNANDLAAPDGYGVAITALFVLSAAALTAASRIAERGRPWLIAAVISLIALLLAIVLQTIEYAHVGFSPGDGGYTSVFYGWTIFLALFALGAAYFTAVLVAEGKVARGAEGQPGPLPGLEEGAFYVRLLASIAVIAWVLLYLL